MCLKLTSFSVQGHFEFIFLQKLKLLLFGLHFLPLQMSFLFTLGTDESNVRKYVNMKINWNHFIYIVIS